MTEEVMREEMRDGWRIPGLFFSAVGRQLSSATFCDETRRKTCEAHQECQRDPGFPADLNRKWLGECRHYRITVTEFGEK